VTEFRSFDNSTCKRVLDPLKPSDLTQSVRSMEKSGAGPGSRAEGSVEVWRRAEPSMVVPSQGFVDAIAVRHVIHFVIVKPNAHHRRA